MITNFAWVEPGVLARSGRPQPADYPWIRENIQTVVSLEGTDEDRKEARELAKVSFVSWPIGLPEIYLTGISQEHLNGIVTMISRVYLRPVLVHCQHGEDRTGLVVAAYRVRVQGWTKQAAMAEARAHGYRWYVNFGLNRTWEAFDG
jgi:tyrosine-protein phosphatase SIW14